MNLTINEIRKSGSHSEEELIQLTLEENMGELRRAQYILQTGHPIQKYAIYSNIHNLFKVNGFSLLFTQLNNELVKQDEDTIAVATREFILIAKSMKEKDQVALLNQTFHFIKNYQLKLADGWYELFELLYCCDITQSIKLINELTDIDCETHLKQRGAKLLQYIPQIERIQLLCMDKDPQVRYEIVKTIQQVYCQFTPEKFSTYLQIKISELIYDYEMFVRIAAIEMFFMVQSHLLDREKIIAKYFFEFLSSQNVQLLMSKICGKVLLEIMDVKPDINRFIKIFHSFALSDKEELRINFAYNLPAILSILKGECYDIIKDVYHELLINDQSIQVRNILMASIPDVISALKIHKIQSLIPLIRKLLDQNIIQYNLYSIIYALWPSFDQQEQLLLSKVLVNDILIDITKQLTIKATPIILEQLLKLHEFFQQCDSYLLLLQPLQLLLNADSLLVRSLASYNIAYLAYHDQSINQLMIHQCLNNTKFRMRICYIDFISQTIDLCSKRYFSVHNFITVLQLSNDKIFDVRIRLARIMKKIQIIIHDNDEPACIAYDQALKILQRERYINEILKQNESMQFSFGDDFMKEQKEHICLARVSADDIDAIEKNAGSISPFIIKSKNCFSHNRKRSSVTRQPVNRSQPNASFTQKLNQIKAVKLPVDMSRRTSVPPVPAGRKLYKPTQFKPNQQRLRK